MRFLFEQDDVLVCYETSVEAPWLHTPPQSFDVRSHMDADGISLSEIAEKLRACANHHTEVETVSLRCTGRRYSVIVLLRELSEERLAGIYDDFEQVCRAYASHRPMTTVLGPEQRDCFALSAADSYRVYSNADTLNTPATPPLG